jgi:molecular chaperone DnaK
MWAWFKSLFSARKPKALPGEGATRNTASSYSPTTSRYTESVTSAPPGGRKSAPPGQDSKGEQPLGLDWQPWPTAAESTAVFTTDPDPDCAAANDGPIVGIDLGTTHSVIAVVRGGRVEVIPNQEGEFLTPSPVSFTEQGELLVGTPARRRAVSDPGRTIYSIKRCLGRAPDELQPAVARLPYEVVLDDTGPARVRIDGCEYTPTEIAALILRKLRAAAEAHLVQQVRRAVLTVPAYFNDAQRQATLDAALLAGFDVDWVIEDPGTRRRLRQPMRVITEPTAAALAHGLQARRNQKLAVFHMGGGTFDISLLDTGDGVLEVKAVGGDTALGGDDFDQALVDHFVDAFPPNCRPPLRNDPVARLRLTEAAEQAKKDLSQVPQVRVHLPFLNPDASGLRDLDLTLTRAEFERLVEPLLLRCRALVLGTLKDAGFRAADIDEVLLVGGMTRVPCVRALFRNIFGKEGQRGVNLDEVVAVGAAIQGAQLLLGSRSELLLLDVTPLTLGLETQNGGFTAIVPRNTTIPTQKSRVFTTVRDNQPGVSVRIYQGESPVADRNRFLGQLDLEGLPPRRRGELRIGVTFDVDANGIVCVSVHEEGSGNSRTLRVARFRQSGLFTANQARRQAERDRKRDSQRRALIDARNQADLWLYRVERLFEQCAGRVSPADLEPVWTLAERVRRAAAEEDVEALCGAVYQLQQVTEALVAYLARRRQGEASSAPSATGSPADADRPLDVNLEI